MAEQTTEISLAAYVRQEQERIDRLGSSERLIAADHLEMLLAHERDRLGQFERWWSERHVQEPIRYPASANVRAWHGRLDIFRATAPDPDHCPYPDGCEDAGACRGWCLPKAREGYYE